MILDEFQRFKSLLDGEDEVALLAQALCNYENVKVLLLSATPFKMYTMHHEVSGDDHYQDFSRTARFLFGSDTEAEALREDLRRYRSALFQVARENDHSDDLSRARTAIQARLGRVMVRTERLSATADRNAMIESSQDLLTLSPQDLEAFALLDKVAQLMEVQDPVEYWKSAPYLLNFMDGGNYAIKRKLLDCLNTGGHREELTSLLKAGQSSLLSWEAIRRYQPLDPANPRLRALATQMLETGAWRLLWIPPSLQYYRVQTGPYADPTLHGFTKALVFSSWQVVPKVIATMCSYEAERRMVSASETKAGYEEYGKRPRLLRFPAPSADRYTGMSMFTLLYPCLTLASLIDPLELCVGLTDGKSEVPDVEQVLSAISRRIEELLAPSSRNTAALDE